MLHRQLMVALVVGGLLSCVAPVYANNLAWEAWQPVAQPNNYLSPYKQNDLPLNITTDCGASEAPSLLNFCLKTNNSRSGLTGIASFLQTQYTRRINGNNTYPTTLLLETVQTLLNWHDASFSGQLAEYFQLVPVSSTQGAGQGNFTGYFTPTLAASRVQTARFTIPIYGKPKSNVNHLSHADIASGALRGKGLEIAWTDDPFNLYVAQVQGSALLTFPDGSRTILDYAGTNNRSFLPISNYLRSKGYKTNNLSNNGIHEWLQANPQKAYEVITSNPRYVFFRDTGATPETASGNGVIPGHTVAVDSRYIPHGSILLAELPRLSPTGQKIGKEWRLLFAQDHGKAITGNGRFDLYTGLGENGEARAYAISGTHRVFMVLRKPNALARLAGL